MNRSKDGSSELKQTGLVDRILEALGPDTKLSTNTVTPTQVVAPTKCEDEEGPLHFFSYGSSVVEMILYLPGHSRLGIIYTVK